MGDHDVLLRELGRGPFSIDGRQYELWKHTQLILDVGEGAPEGFSLPAGDDRQLMTRSRVSSAGKPRTRRGRAFRPPPPQPQTAGRRRGCLRCAWNHS